MTNYISNKTELLLKYNESSTLELITNISKIINNIENQKINDDNNYYIINKIWLEKAKKFIIEYERLCKLNNEKDLKFFLNKTFNSDYIYCKYLGEESSKITIKEKDKNIPIFPGPIDNYSITLYKDFWKDPLNIQDNFFIKDNLEINKDYYLINKENWDFLDKFFYSTNELIRRGNNNDLISLKCLIFHEKLINKNYQNYLIRRYIQILKNETVSDLKNKIIRCINELDKHEIEKIEIAVREAIMNMTAERSGDIFWLTNPVHFHDDKIFINSMNLLKKEYEHSTEEFIEHFKKTYIEPFPPAWILGELLPMGNVNIYYRNLKDKTLKKLIARQFCLHAPVLESWLSVLTLTRNSCCHHSRVWNKVNKIIPNDMKNMTRPWITRPADKRRIYYNICIIKYFLDIISPNNDFLEKLQLLFVKFPQIDLSAMGFPKGWEQEPIWNIKAEAR